VWSGCFEGGEVSEDALGHGRAADVSEADEEDGDLVGLCA
jgi:hypothetical protein